MFIAARLTNGAIFGVLHRCRVANTGATSRAVPSAHWTFIVIHEFAVIDQCEDIDGHLLDVSHLPLEQEEVQAMMDPPSSPLNPI